MIKLYSYWRSSAAYRVRIALNLKSIEHEIIAVNMLKDGGEQHSDTYRQLNPQELVPTLVDGELVLSQSLAIIEYLDESYPGQSLLPATAVEKAEARQLAQILACDVHPLNNLRVLQYLKQELEVDDEKKNAWYAHWIRLGFGALEAKLAARSNGGPFCQGDTPGLADLCLVPQMYNAHRFAVALDDFPTLRAIEKTCLEIDAFKRAVPENQVDATG